MKKIFGLLILSFVLLGRVDASPQIGQVAPNFECVTADGQTVQLSDYLGKVVILDFWASWCGPCREEMPFLVNLYRSKEECDFEILGINIDNKKKNMEAFLSKLDDRPSFSILLDKEKRLLRYMRLKRCRRPFLLTARASFDFGILGLQSFLSVQQCLGANFA